MDVEPDRRSRTGAGGGVGGWLQALISAALRKTKAMSKNVEKTLVVATLVGAGPSGQKKRPKSLL